ncbi:DUF4158 domain-containing protein [Streptomyces catenulae]|uniref:DUF4158 domain-containing protein n=1 Tax=Streptomyces catenulae TaxID=66875 RepID=A0ABV2Z2C4_9ACTN
MRHLPFSPSRDEVEWAAARTDCDKHLLAQLLTLKSYQRMGYFPEVAGWHGGEGCEPYGERRRTAARQRTRLSYAKAKARKIAEAVMRSEAASKSRLGRPAASASDRCHEHR